MNRIDPRGRFLPLVLAVVAAVAIGGSVMYKAGTETERHNAEVESLKEFRDKAVNGELEGWENYSDEEYWADQQRLARRCPGKAATIARDMPGSSITGPPATGELDVVATGVSNAAFWMAE